MSKKQIGGSHYKSFAIEPWTFVQENYKGYKVYAWALPKSLPLLLEKGFVEGDTCVYVERQVEDLSPPGEQCFVSC